MLFAKVCPYTGQTKKTIYHLGINPGSCLRKGGVRQSPQGLGLSTPPTVPSLALAQSTPPSPKPTMSQRAANVAITSKTATHGTNSRLCPCYNSGKTQLKTTARQEYGLVVHEQNQVLGPYCPHAWQQLTTSGC